MSYNEKCHCGHAKKSHSGGYIGMRLYSTCKTCDCIQYSPKSEGKEEWKRMQRLRHEGYGDPLPSSMSDNCRSEREKIIDKINEINEKARTDPETIKRKQELYEELSKLTSEDLSKQITSRSDKVRCLFLDPETIEKSGRKDCIRTGIEPSPSDELCEGCSFALYGATIVDSINKHTKRKEVR